MLQVGTTVSPTYAAEVSGHPSVAPHMNKFFGIINGIDMDIWDPQSDQFLPKQVCLLAAPQLDTSIRRACCIDQAWLKLSVLEGLSSPAKQGIQRVPHA